jgi:hypothetical protein
MGRRVWVEKRDACYGVFGAQLTGLAMQQHFPNIPLATAIAGGAVISRLLAVLADKGLLSREEILAILGDAQRCLTPTATKQKKPRPTPGLGGG